MSDPLSTSGDDSNAVRPVDHLRSPSRWVKTLVWTGVIIFVANIALAWYFALCSHSYVTTPLVAMPPSVLSLASSESQLVKRDDANAKAVKPLGATELAMYKIADATPNTCVLLNRAMDAEVHMKCISNKQTIMLVTMAAAFGLIAVGFSLFVMGIHSAFEFSAGSPDKGSIILKATSPGLLCFVLAAVLLVFAVTRQNSVRLGEFTLEGTSRPVAAGGTTSTPTTGRDSGFEEIPWSHYPGQSDKEDEQ